MKSFSISRFVSLGAVAAVLAAAGIPAQAYPASTDPAPHAGQASASSRADKPLDRSYWYGRPLKWDRSHREAILRYYSTRKASCPPGLIRTGKGCLPQGQSKKRYAIGKMLPRTVVVEPLPDALLRQLPPPPLGHIYRRVDGDVAIISLAARKVVDAVVLPPSAGR